MTARRSIEPPATSLASLQSDPELAMAAAEVIWAGNQAEQAAEFLTAGLKTTLVGAKADFAAVVSFTAGHWSVLAESGKSAPLPFPWLADILDREVPGLQPHWAAASLLPHGGSEILVLHLPGAASTVRARQVLVALAPLVGQQLEIVRRRQREARRLNRVQAILDVTGRWYQTREMEPLLVQMAQAATRLLASDRASIFLWDRPNRTLVARPALGVDSGELRIPDDTGVVGQVVHTGQSRRVDLERDQGQIDHSVDATLGYQTRTLLCVPLRGHKGELFGVFETINKLEGNFTDEDEEVLTELAAQAGIALENARERERLLESRRQITEQAAQGVQLVGQSAVIEALRSTIRRVAETDLAILIMGENGTGKEVVSQSVHYLSPRRDQPFIAVNCAALTETLLESELFGHEKGAFTDAHEAHPGKFELANGGTLFLDEIGDLSAGGQAKLLRVLEEKVVVRVGGSKAIHTDARVIAATNQNLAEMVRQKKFRQDLFYRLNVVTLLLPPLRERPDDILLLAEYFLNDFCRKARRTPPRLSPAARRRLETHTWPGNIRELRNLMERLAYLVPADQIEAEDLAFILFPAGEAPAAIPADLELSEATNKFQTDYIQQAIHRAAGNMSKAAEQLGLHRSNLYRKMRQLSMTGDEEA